MANEKDPQENGGQQPPPDDRPENEPAQGNGNDVGSYIWRGGEKIYLHKDDKRFTAQMKGRARPGVLGAETGCEHVDTFTGPNLEEFKVEDPEDLDFAMEKMRDREDVAFASHVYTLADDPGSEMYLTDEVTIQFKPDTSDSQIEEIVNRYHLELEQPVEGLERTYVCRVTNQATENTIKIANRLHDEPQVLLAEANIAVRQEDAYRPLDPLYPRQWHLFNEGGPFLDAKAHIDAERAWDITRGERRVIVAVADDSVDLSHPDFQGEGKIVAPIDFRGNDFEPLPEASDDNHGTACAAVAVAEENGRGSVGVAPGCALMPIRTSGFIDDNSIEALCNWVIDNNASVLSCSWSAASRFFNLSLRMKAALTRAATKGRGGKGCVVLFAAGNSNRPVNGTVDEQDWPDNTPNGSTRWVNGFAVHPNIIAVSASSSLATKSAYSNWGREISVCAPSNNVPPPTYPRITQPTPGRGIVTADRVGPSGYSSSDFTTRFGGTSSATPVVAGLAGLILSVHPDLTAAEVKEIIEISADKIEDPAADLQLGNRFGTYDDDGHSLWFGYGRVNAFAAVSEAVRRRDAAQGGTSTVRLTSSPDLPIPDRNAAGVSDAIEVTSGGEVRDLSIEVDITHTYIGDLIVSLTSPAGTTVDLHRRQGGRADNLRQTYEAAGTPGLHPFLGQQARGNWLLRVQDLARLDTGILRSWGLTLEVGSAPAGVDLVDEAGEIIPDNEPDGIVRTLAVNAGGQAATLEVALDITHTYIGDLRVVLTAPSGRSAVLHGRTGGSADDLIRVYHSDEAGPLQSLRGEPLRGNWRLRVSDLAGRDVGKLNWWGLKIAVS